MFDVSFSELLTIAVVTMLVFGPKELPKYLRKAGQFAGKLRRIAYDMRQKSGIDEVLRTEGIDRDIAEIRRLTRGEITGVVASVRSVADATRADLGAPRTEVNGARVDAPRPYAQPLPAAPPEGGLVVDREHEYPTDGPDAYGALPEGAPVYEGSLAPSPLADDPLYARGDDPQPAAAELLREEARS